MAEQRQYATVEELTEPGQMPEDDVQLSSGRWVRVRALTRAEAHHMNSIEGMFETEVFALSRGIVAPKINRAQVEAWLKVAVAGELDPASSRISELSGMSDDADKRAVRDFETGAVSEFRVLPSDEVGHDGGDPETDDE